MNILHISLTALKNETRVMKQAYFADKHPKINFVHIVAINDGTVPQKEVSGNAIHINRKKLYSRSLPKNYFFQSFKYLEFFFFLLKFAHKNRIKFVTIHCLPLLPVAILLKMFLGVKVIYDAHELETEIHNISPLKRGLYKIIEEGVIRHVDHTFVVSPSIMRWYLKRYPIKGRISLLMNIHDRVEPVRTPRLHKAIGVDESIRIILYQGALIRGRGIEKMTEAFEGLDIKGYVLVFMGYGSLEGYIREKSEKTDRIFLHPPVQIEELAEYTKSAYCGVCYVENGSLNDHYCLPNKFFEYLYSGVPIIASNGPDMSEILNKFSVGVSLEEFDTAALKLALDKISVIRDAKLPRRIKLVNEAYSWQRQEQVLNTVYTNLMHL